MPLYFTTLIAFHVHSINEVLCVQKYSPNQRKLKKKHLLICTDSSVPQIQADQLNETNYHLAFRVSSKGLCVESTQSKVFFEIAVLHLFGKLFEAHLRQSTFQQSCYLMLATMLNNFTLCQKFSKELPESVKYSCCNKHHWRRKT